MSETAKGCGGIVLLAMAYLGWCYFEQAANHRWEPQVRAAMAKTPGTRLVSSFGGGDLINPVSWFWPAKLRMVYATPDTSTPDRRFYIMSFGRNDREEKQPAIWLTSIDCEAGTKATYWPTRDASDGEPARTATGEPVVAPDGQVYRRNDTGIASVPEQMKAFCETDWSKERKAIANFRASRGRTI